MPEYENPEAGWELETDSQEPIQVDAGYDEDCCEQMRQIYLQIMLAPELDEKYQATEWIEYLDSLSCEEFMEKLGGQPIDLPYDESTGMPIISPTDKTLNDAYNECVNAKMPQGGDFTMGEPIDLAWRMLKHG